VGYIAQLRFLSLAILAIIVSAVASAQPALKEKGTETKSPAALSIAAWETLDKGLQD